MRLYTSKALAKVLGLSVQEVSNLTTLGVIAPTKGRTYSLEESAARIIAYAKDGWGSEQEAVDAMAADYSTERAKLMRAKRIAVENETKQQEGLLHSAADVENIVTAMLLNFRSRIMAIPSSLAPRLSVENDTNTIYGILKEATDDALNELSDYDNLFGRTGGKTYEMGPGTIAALEDREAQ